MHKDTPYPLNRRQLLAGLGAVGVASASAGLGTAALFSDSESLTDNSIAAGEIDLAVHYDATYTGSSAGNLAPNLSGVVDGSDGLFYTLNDVKPGDTGSVTFCFELSDNPAYIWACVENLVDAENGQSDAEESVEGVDTDGLGELDDAIVASASYCDSSGNMISGGEIATDVSLSSLLATLAAGLPLNFDEQDVSPGSQTPYTPSTSAGQTTGPCLCIEWELPLSAGNEIQSDSLEFDIVFHAVQARNSDGTDNPCGTVNGVAPLPDTQVAKILASDGDPGDRFGKLEIDGDTIVAGAYRDDDNGTDSGSAYVFVRSGSTWTQEAKLTPSDGAAGDLFGFSASVSGDTILVGSRRDDDNGGDSGSAYVFVRSGSAWTQQAKLTANDAASADQFGFSVSLDGDTALVGALVDDDNGFNSGSAYVFRRTGTTWSQEAKLLASDGQSNNLFGYDVSLDGDTALISANKDEDGTVPGSAYVFVRSGTTWSEQAILSASDETFGDEFGISVSLDGDTALIGAYEDDTVGTDTGSAYVFTRSGSTWSQEAKLTASDGAAGDIFGNRVSIDGDTALIGAPFDDDNGTDSGSAYLFTRSGTVWTEQAKLLASDGDAGDWFGAYLDLDAGTVVVGAPQDDDNGTDSGSMYVFE